MYSGFGFSGNIVVSPSFLKRRKGSRYGDGVWWISFESDRRLSTLGVDRPLKERPKVEDSTSTCMFTGRKDHGMSTFQFSLSSILLFFSTSTSTVRIVCYGGVLVLNVFIRFYLSSLVLFIKIVFTKRGFDRHTWPLSLKHQLDFLKLRRSLA